MSWRHGTNNRFINKTQTKKWKTMETLNYEKFAFIHRNREINDGLVKRLMNSITLIGYIKSKPITVNEKMEIMDGQHRFVACKNLKLPIVYEIEDVKDELIDSVIIELNRQQQIWRIIEYLKFYAKKGDATAITLLKLNDIYGFDISSTLHIAMKNYHGRGEKFRKGMFGEIEKDVEKIFEFVQHFRALPFWNASLARSLKTFYLKANDRQRQKLINNMLKINQRAIISDFLTVYANIVNKNSHYVDRISF